MSKKKIIFVVGKTSSSKDTITKYIKEKYGIEMICSYTTRPMRDYEVDGFQHYFVTEEIMNMLKKRNDLIAYTKFPKTGYEYCATASGMSKGVMTYIINPEGIKWFRENGTKDLETVCIYVDLAEDVILKRARGRGDKESDIIARLDSEREEFDAFKDSGDFDYIINTDKSLEEMYKEVDKIMKKIMI